MKKLLLLFSGLMISLLISASTIDLNGTAYPVDTTIHYQVGPGTWYSKFTVTIGNNKHNCYLLEVDLNNPYNLIKAYQSGGEFGKTESLPSSANKQDSTCHHPIGGVNCNFWAVTQQLNEYTQGILGQSYGGTAEDGVLIGQPDSWDRGFGDVGYTMVDNLGQLWIENMWFDGKVAVGNSEFTILETNRSNLYYYENSLVMYNYFLGSKATRATTGTELVFEPVAWAINDTMVCRVVSKNNTGGTHIQKPQGVLQGLGTAQTFLDQLQEGQEFKLYLGVYSDKDNSFRPNIMHMVTGNCLVLYNGELTQRNYNEQYNNQNYPRTMIATNQTHDKCYLLVAEKPGMYTWQMASILKNCGAAFAAGMDGGGSAQMCLHGKVQNPTTESNPRSVANSFWVVSTAPEDSVVTRLETSRPEVTLPIYGSYQPAFYCYNQYDVLLARNFKGTTLSCDPSVGYIDADGYFVCQGSGILHCEYMNATYDVQINAVTDAAFHFRLDSVLISDDTHYQVEVLAEAGGQTISINPVLLEWHSIQPPTPEGEIALPCVCGAGVDENGVLIAGENGRSLIVGKLGEHTDTLIVDVEIPWQRPLLWTNMADAATRWNIKPAATSWNPTITINEDGKAVLSFNYAAARKPNIAFTVNEKLYSLPEQMEIRFSSENVVFDYANIMLRANNEASERTKKIESLVTGDNSIMIDLHQVFDGTDIAIYPIHLQSFTFYFKTMDAGQKSIVFDGIYLHYKTITLNYQPSTLNSLKVYPNPAEEYVIIDYQGKAISNRFTLYDLQGRVMQTVTNTNRLNISTLPAGTYILQAGNESVQIIKK